MASSSQSAQESRAESDASGLISKCMRWLFDIFIMPQARFQSMCMPASWLSFSHGLHSEQVEWTTMDDSITKETLVDAVWQAAQDKFGYEPISATVATDKSTRVVIFFFTKQLLWMDQITLDMDASSKKITLLGESTGMLPLIVPLACLWNLVLFWFPFRDGRGKCGKEMHVLHQETQAILQGKLNKNTTDLLKSRTVRYSKSNPRRHGVHQTKRD